MRNKGLNNNQTGSISKGGVLYRPGEMPVLTKEQLAQSNLVSKLPHDFPFANWEGMNTKQQLQQMKYSGLNPQEQWSLLNANVPLGVLKEHNQAQEYAAAQATPVQAPALLSAKAVQALAQNIQKAGSNPSISPSLQLGKTSGELEKESSGIRAKAMSTSPSISANKGIDSGFRTAGEGQSVGQTLDTDKTPSPIPTPNPSQAPTPNPNQTPPPEPGPSLDLFGVDVNYLSEESRKRLYIICKQLNGDGVVQPELYRSYLKELDNIRQEEEKGIYFEKIKSGASEEATWGTEMIYNQRIYSNVPGTFGPWGSIPENVCGVAAIHNVNQILGINTRFDELVYSIQKEYLVTTNLFGKLGMSIDALCGYYINAGAAVTDYDSHSKIPNTHDAYIVMYVYKDSNGKLGAHYVAASYDKDVDCYKVFNDLNPHGPEKWDTLLPSSYLKIATEAGHSDQILAWNVFGIDKPNRPQINKAKASIGKMRAPTPEKGLWKRMSK
jgi:hypothetical protein